VSIVLLAVVWSLLAAFQGYREDRAFARAWALASGVVDE